MIKGKSITVFHCFQIFIILLHICWNTFQKAFNYNTLLEEVHLLLPFAALYIFPLELLCTRSCSLCIANKCSQICLTAIKNRLQVTN